MWIETMSGVVVNLETGSCVYLDKRKDKWAISLEITNMTYILGSYQTEKNALDMLEAFKQKLRRCGEKVFRFKEEVGKNDEVAD